MFSDGRLRVELRYSDSRRVDVYDWEIYTPSELSGVATGAGLDHLFSCAWFDRAVRPGPEHLRMQHLLERPRDGVPT